MACHSEAERSEEPGIPDLGAANVDPVWTNPAFRDHGLRPGFSRAPE
jgi:hypothetical protein